MVQEAGTTTTRLGAGFTLLVISLVTAGCGETTSSDPGPPPWTSGSIVHTQAFVVDGLVALAGRVDSQNGLQCDVDDLNAPAFANCLRDMPLFYRDDACATRDIVDD